MTECRAGDSDAPGGNAADSRHPAGREVDVEAAAGGELVSETVDDGQPDDALDRWRNDGTVVVSDASAACASPHGVDSDAAQVNSGTTQVSAQSEVRRSASVGTAGAPASSPGRRPSVRNKRRFTVTRLLEGAPASPPSLPGPPGHPDTAAPASAPAAVPAAAPIAAPSAAPAAASTAVPPEENGWDYGPSTEPAACAAAAVAPAPPPCQCSQSTLPPPLAAPPAGRYLLPPSHPLTLTGPGITAAGHPAITRSRNASGTAATVHTGVNGPVMVARNYATLQPGVGGLPSTAYYHSASRQPLLAPGSSATLQAGLAGSARLQQALQSRLAGTATIHPGLNFSHPLYRHLATTDYNPAQTISYGHSDGRQLTVRRQLDWEVPDLHTVRKYASDLESDSDAETVLSVVPTHRSARVRTTWTNKVEFILACLGYAVGLGNLWRFPYLCYKSGGGAFFIPYLIMMVVCSIPLLLMELTIGQFTRQGPVGAMGRLCPLFKGAGVAPVVISFIFCTYYNVVIAWTLYYLFSSFSSELPWATCNHTEWNTPSCEDSHRNRTLPNAGNSAPSHAGNSTLSYAGNGTVPYANASAYGAAVSVVSRATTPAEEYFSHRVLEISGGVDVLGGVRIPLLLTLLLAWVLVYFSIWKSIRSSGKVVYFTVIAPYLLLTAFLWRALTLDGASTGIRYLFQPRWELLADSKVWVNALAQNFNSVGIGFGSMITFASYNKFENRTILLDTMIICMVNLLTSVIAGIIVFATLGNIAMELNRPIQKVVVDGPGLVYIVYPKALASMPFPQLWSVLFFFMLLCLGLDSQFATLEVVITSLQDGYARLVRRYLKRHELLVLVICLMSFGLGLPYVTQGGMYAFQLMDYNVTNTSLILLALCEVVAVAWVYSTERLTQDFFLMTGKRPSNYFRVCLKFIAPLLILAIWVFSLIDYVPLTYGPYRYPEWAYGLGWLLASLPVLPIPICMALTLWRASGDTLVERLKASVEPDRRVKRELGFEPTVSGPDHGDDPELYYEMAPLTAQIPYSAVNGDADGV